jgi:hypothetical protein
MIRETIREAIKDSKNGSRVEEHDRVLVRYMEG